MDKMQTKRIGRYPYIAAIGYKSPKLHPCNHEAYEPVFIDDRLHPAWIEFFQQNNFAINEQLRYFYVSAYERGIDVKPAPEDVLNVFQMGPQDVKVVLIGQDPYPSVYKEESVTENENRKRTIYKPIANGWAFSTHDSKITSSLERIFASIPDLFHKPNDYSLGGWIRQGVFLMNKTPVLWAAQHGQPPLEASVASVPENKWHGLVRNVCIFLVGVGTARGKPVNFLLVGEKAKSLKEAVGTCIEANHPSGRSTLQFDGKCFQQLTMIDWKQASLP